MENIGIEQFRKKEFAISTRTQGEYNKLMEILKNSLIRSLHRDSMKYRKGR